MPDERILLVDDDVTLVKTYQSILRRKGYLVDVALTGYKALKKAKENLYDLAILDIKLPDIPGYEVATIIRTQDKKISMILITGYPEFQESIDALKVGIHEILLKPITAGEILRAAEDAFSSSIPLQGINAD